MRGVGVVVVLVLSACGDNAHPLIDAPRPDAATADAPAHKKLAVIFGQSNAASRGVVSELADLAYAQPYPVPFIEHMGTDVVPPVWEDHGWGPTQPYPDATGVDRFGVEVTLARALEADEPGQWAIAKIAVGSTALGGEWNPMGVWPTAGDNLFQQQVAFVKQALADQGADLGALIWIQGESDCPTVALGGWYGIRLAQFIGSERWALGDPSVPFIYGRLNARVVGPGCAGVRAGEESNQTPTAVMVDQDPYPLRSDVLHYTTEGVLGLGRAYGAAVLGHHEE